MKSSESTGPWFVELAIQYYDDSAGINQDRYVYCLYHRVHEHIAIPMASEARALMAAETMNRGAVK